VFIYYLYPPYSASFLFLRATFKCNPPSQLKWISDRRFRFLHQRRFAFSFVLIRCHGKGLPQGTTSQVLCACQSLIAWVVVQPEGRGNFCLKTFSLSKKVGAPFAATTYSFCEPSGSEKTFLLSTPRFLRAAHTREVVFFFFR